MLKMSKRTESAYNFAKERHGETLDDCGNNYFDDHCVKVAECISILQPDNEDLIIAALLHDIVEDTKTTFEEIRKKFGEVVCELVYEVTHVIYEQGKKHFPNLKSEEAGTLKMIDKASNFSRMNCWSFKRRQKYFDEAAFWK